jgi:signal transduction histidine kinase
MSENMRQDTGVPSPLGIPAVEPLSEEVVQQTQAVRDQVKEVADRMAYLTDALMENGQPSPVEAVQTSSSQHGDGWLESVMNSIMSGVLIVDRQTHRIVDINAMAVHLIGLPREQIVGHVCHRFVCPAEQGQCPISDLGQCVNLSERVLIKGDGQRLPVIKTVTEVQWQGRPYLIESFIDISGWKQAQQDQADVVQRMENANKELTEFAYVVSHDLKAPLRGIKTLATWITNDYSEKLDKEGQEQLSLLLSRVSRMEDLISGILQYSRAGRPLEEDQGVVDLAEALPSIIDMVAAPSHITITLDTPLPRVQVDATRIGQVFQNLLSNAIKFMDKPQGRIRIDCIEDDGFWRFSVADNGPGIEEKYFDRIFKLFQTLAPRDESESSGVGLAVVKKIVTFYGGQVWVESKVGEGSTFFFTLPKIRGPLQAAQEPGPSD